MKLKQLYLSLILLISGCSVTSPYKLATNKEYVGTVKDVRYVDYGAFKPTMTYIYTDKTEFIIDSKVDIEKGTKCYTYNDYVGTRTYVVWEKAKTSYRID